MFFPVLLVKKRHARVTSFKLEPRAPGAFTLSDNLLLALDGAAPPNAMFILLKRMLPRALQWRADWPVEEQKALADDFGMAAIPRIEGDSWYLPFFFALACAEWQKKWPPKVLVSGAIRKGRGFRCVSVGGALHKLRFAKMAQSLCFLPKSNVNQLNRRCIDTSCCVALPYNISQCLAIWRGYVFAENMGYSLPNQSLLTDYAR